MRVATLLEVVLWLLEIVSIGITALCHVVSPKPSALMIVAIDPCY